MAVYGADVRVKVINLSQLTKLSDKLDQVNKKVNYLNASLQKLGRRVKTPNVDVKTDKALKKLQRLNAEWDKLERRKKLKPMPAAGGGGGGGGGGRGGGRGFGGSLLQGGLAGAGLGLAGPLGGLAGIAASALNPVQLLGAALGVAAVGAVDYANAAARAAAETQKFQQALRGITFGDDYVAALESVDRLSESFQQDLGETTKQFTKLTAAATANGLSIKETEDIYKGLAAANVALGGDNERLQGILLATGQVLSKGKVQAEELRGQIGERLPGAFALFAEAIGKTPKELDQALNDGAVTVEDFLTFTEKLFKRFGKNAEEIVNGPALAGQRLEKALGDLQRNVGTLLAPIGAAFQNVFTEIVKAINSAIIALNNFLGIGLDGAIAKTQRKIQDSLNNIQRFEGLIEQGATGQGGKANKNFERRLSQAKGELNRQIDRLQELQAQRKGQALTPPTKPEETDLSGGGGKSGKKPRENRSKELEIQLKYEVELNRVAASTVGLYGSQLKEQELINKEIVANLQRNKALEEIKLKELYADERLRENLIVEARYEGKLLEIDRERAEIKRQMEQARANALQPLEDQKELLEAQLNGTAERVALEQQARAIAKDIEGLTAGEVLVMLQRNKALEEQVKKLEEMKEVFKEMSSVIATEMTNAFKSLITGSKSANEAISDMLKSVGDSFIDMALRIIQQQMTMILNGLLMKALGITMPGASMSSGNGINWTSPDAGVLGQLGGIPTGYANGGAPPVNQVSLVGERGPELFIPNQSGRIVSNEAMSNYMPSNESLTTTNAPININYSGPMLNFNGDEYIPRSEAPKLVEQGAKMGEQRTMNHLRNNRSSRQRIGI